MADSKLSVHGLLKGLSGFPPTKRVCKNYQTESFTEAKYGHIHVDCRFPISYDFAKITNPVKSEQFFVITCPKEV